MNIVLTTHNYWPYYRRGSSRHISNLAGYLVNRGHSVHIITSKPGKSNSVTMGNLRITYHPYVVHPLLQNYRIERFHGFILGALRSLLFENNDITYCMFHTDGFAASLVHLLRGKKFILNVSTVPFKYYWKDRQTDELMFKIAAQTAAKCIMPSIYARKCMEGEYNISGAIVPMAVDFAHFTPENKRKSDKKYIFFASAAYDERKGIHILLKAFEMLKQKVPNAVLRIASQQAPGFKEFMHNLIPDTVRSSVEMIGAGRLHELPALYAESSITVLPSLHEVFGMVLIESLACGTPVVGCDSGALSETITRPDIGFLFDPKEVNGRPTNAAGLCDAMVNALELARDPKTVIRCREYSERYSLERVGAEFEQVFLSVCEKEK